MHGNGRSGSHRHVALAARGPEDPGRCRDMIRRSSLSYFDLLATEEKAVEKESQDLPTWVILLFSPTRFLFDRLGVTITGWTISWLTINVIFLFTLGRLHEHLHHHLILLLLWFIPCSRIAEIVYAFYNDAFDRIKEIRPRTKLTKSRRLKLLGVCYCEVAVCYASLYFVVPFDAFFHHPVGPFESLYFSWITITTTGFGDIYPVAWYARLGCMTELAFGLMLIVFAVGAYLSMPDQS